MCNEHHWDLLPSSSNPLEACWSHLKIPPKQNLPTNVWYFEMGAGNESKTMMYVCGVISIIIQLILKIINDNNIFILLPVDDQNPKAKYFF